MEIYLFMHDDISMWEFIYLSMMEFHLENYLFIHDLSMWEFIYLSMMEFHLENYLISLDEIPFGKLFN